MDDLFGDEEETAPPAKEESRADKMAAAKAAKDAKKKIDRYTCKKYSSSAAHAVLISFVAHTHTLARVAPSSRGRPASHIPPSPDLRGHGIRVGITRFYVPE